MTSIRHLLKNTSIREAFTLSSGSSVAQLISLVSYPLLTIFYDPKAFGDFKLFESSVYLLTILATASYELAIVLPSERSGSLSLWKVSCSLGLSVSLLLILPGLLFKDRLSVYLGTDSLVIVLIPAGVFLVAMLNTHTQWLIREKLFSALSKGRILQSSSTSIFQIGLSFFQQLWNGLIIGYLGGRLLSGVYYLLQSGISFREIASVHISEIRASLKAYSEQPRFMMISRLVGQLALESPVFLIGSFFTGPFLGLYGLAFKALSAPTQFVGLSIGQVFYKQLSDRFNDRSLLLPFILKTWGGLFILGVIPFACLFFFGESIFAWIFGEEWTGAGTIASVLSPALLLYFITGPTEFAAFQVLRLQQQLSGFSVLNLILRSSALIIGYYYRDFFLAIQLLCYAQILFMLLQNSYLYRQVYRYDQSLKTETGTIP